MPRLSIITALFNCLAHTQEMWATLQATLPPDLRWELILVDDYSSDGTREWLASLRDPRVKVVLQDANRGFAAANNRGGAMARGDVLLLANNDLVFEAGWFPPLWDAHQNLASAGIVGNVQRTVTSGELHHTGVYVNARGKLEHDRTLSAGGGIRPMPAVTAACALLRRDVFTGLGGFDEGYLNGFEDGDLCLRAGRAGLTNAVALSSTVRHHVSISPGRRTHNVRNGFRFMLTWQQHLPRLAAESWQSLGIRDPWERRLNWPDRALATLLRPTLRHPDRALPGFLYTAVATNMTRQLRRWTRLHPDLPTIVSPVRG